MVITDTGLRLQSGERESALLKCEGCHQAFFAPMMVVRGSGAKAKCDYCAKRGTIRRVWEALTVATGGGEVNDEENLVTFSLSDVLAVAAEQALAS